MASEKKAIWALLLFSPALIITIISSGLRQTKWSAFIAVISHWTTRHHFCLVCPYHYDLTSEGSLHGAKIFLVLVSSYLSARIILALGSTTPCMVWLLTLSVRPSLGVRGEEIFKDEGGGRKERESQEGVCLPSVFPLFSPILPFPQKRLILALQRF